METTASTGTGTITLTGAVAGYQSFSVIGNANTTYYTIVGGTEWEVGIGTYTSSGTTLSRNTVLESSNGGSLVNFSAGTKNVFVTYPAEESVDQDTAMTLTNKTISGASNTLSSIANASLTNSAITINGTSTSLGGSINVGTVTSVTGTSPVASSGGNTPAISLASGYGDTQNPYASKTANFVLAAPNGSAGTPTFRAIVAADIPTLNQNTTGTASNVTGIVNAVNGGTGLSSVGTSGNVLTSNGTSWTSATPPASLGIGQTWQYPSRAANTTYTNTTGRPMFIVISAWGTGVINVRFELFVNGTLLARDAAFEASGTLGACVSAIIPSGSTYSISNVVGTLTWAELR